MIAGVPISALRRVAIEMQMFAQLFGPRAIKALANPGHAGAQHLQVGTAIVHDEIPVTLLIGPLLATTVTVADIRGNIANEAICILAKFWTPKLKCLVFAAWRRSDP